MFIEELFKDKSEFSEKVIKDIHSLILMDHRENRGVYRRIPVMIMGAVHTPPLPYLVSVQMEQLIKDYTDNTSGHLIELIAKFHLDFETIHPFIDGNGRTGRLLLNLELMKNGYPTINIKYSDRRRYYNCFTSYHTNNDPTDMIMLVAENVEAEIKRYIDIVKMSNDVSDNTLYQEEINQEDEI